MSLTAQWAHAIIVYVNRPEGQGGTRDLYKQLPFKRRQAMYLSVQSHYTTMRLGCAARAITMFEPDMAIVVAPTDSRDFQDRDFQKEILNRIETVGSLHVPDVCCAVLQHGYHVVQFGSWTCNSALEIAKYVELERVRPTRPVPV